MKPNFMELNDKRGSALIGVIIAIGLISSLSLIIPKINENQLQQVKISRIRSITSSLEMRLRSQLSHSASFENCNESTGAQSCRIKSDIITRFLRTHIPGTACSTSSSQCGLELFNNQVTPATPLTSNTSTLIGSINSTKNALEFNLLLRYTGADVSVKDTPLIISVPYDLLQKDITDCGLINPARPIFSGYESDSGRPKCLPLPVDCSPGSFITSVNRNNLTTTCSQIPSAQVSCGNDQEFIGDFSWTNSNSISRNCYARKNPFSLFTFSSATTPSVSPTPSPTPTIVTAGSPTPTPMASATPTPSNSTCPPRTLNITSCPPIYIPVDSRFDTINLNPGVAGETFRHLVIYGDIACVGPKKPGEFIPWNYHDPAKAWEDIPDPVNDMHQHCLLASYHIATCINGSWEITSCEPGFLTLGAGIGAGG